MTSLTSADPVTRARRTPPRRREVARRAAGLLGLAVALGVWQGTALALDTYVLPTFTASASVVGELVTGPVLTEDILPSVGRVLIGFMLAAVLGIVLGLTLGSVRWLGDLCAPLMNFMRSVPMPLLIPAALVLFGLGGTMVIALIVSASTWPILLNSFDAVRRVEPLYVDTARMCGLRGPTLFWKVLLPATLPSIFAGLRVALSISLVVLVVAEILGASSGIGYRIQNAAQTFAITSTYAGVIVLACLGWLFDTTFLAVERRLLAWEQGMTGRAT